MPAKNIVAIDLKDPRRATPEGEAPVLETATVPIGDLVPHPGNYRIHDLPSIQRTLKAIGQYRTVVVNKGTFTGEPNQILAGHGTIAAAKAIGWDSIAVNYVDVDHEIAGKILVIDNHLPELGENDPRGLAELLGSFPDLDFTGFDPGDLDEMITDLKAADQVVTVVDEETPGWTPQGMVVSYQIVFDNEDQLAKWNGFTKRLKALREEPTIAARLTGHVMDFLNANGGY